MARGLTKTMTTLLLLMAAACGAASGQTPVTAGQSGGVPVTPTPVEGTLLDRVVAVVNGDLVLESDVDEEERFAALQPVTEPTGRVSRARAVERLINRDLILQQLKIQPQAAVTDKQVDDELLALRKVIPACKVDHCETEAGWTKFLADHGFTDVEVRERWRQRIETLRYIEQRFRMGIRIPPAEVKSYYETTLLPEYAKQGVKAPGLAAVTDRIQEVLLQQQVSSLLGDWLKSLRAQGTVRVVGQDEAKAE